MATRGRQSITPALITTVLKEAREKFGPPKTPAESAEQGAWVKRQVDLRRAAAFGKPVQDTLLVGDDLNS